MRPHHILLAALALPTALTSTAPAAVYSAGHGDFGVAYEPDESWFPHLHFDASTVLDGAALGPAAEAYEFEAAEITILVPNAAKVTPGVTLAFLGNPSSSSVWVLPQVQAADVPFFGLATEELDGSEWIGGTSFALTGYEGPGNFALWSTGTFGNADVKWRTNDGLTAADNETLQAGSHAHYNWGFTEPGTYELEVTVSAMHTEDGIQSSVQTLTFQVVPEPASGAFLAIGAALLGCSRRTFGRRRGAWKPLSA